MEKFAAVRTFKVYVKVTAFSAYNLVGGFGSPFAGKALHQILFCQTRHESVYGALAGRIGKIGIRVHFSCYFIYSV